MLSQRQEQQPDNLMVFDLAISYADSPETPINLLSHNLSDLIFEEGFERMVVSGVHL